MLGAFSTPRFQYRSTRLFWLHLDGAGWRDPSTQRVGDGVPHRLASLCSVKLHHLLHVLHPFCLCHVRDIIAHIEAACFCDEKSRVEPNRGVLSFTGTV